MKDVKVTHKPNVFLLGDSLASVTDTATIAHGGKTTTARSAMLLLRRDGHWRIKAMAEGGWGDMKPAEGASAGPGSQSGSSGQGAAPSSTQKESGDGR